MKTQIMAVLAVLIVGVAAAGAYAFGPRFGNEEMQTALEAGDYEAFMEAVEDGDKPFVEQMTEERFNERVEHYQSHQAIRDAVEAGDYDAWYAAMKEIEKPRPIDVVTEDNFDIFVQMHEAREAGDFDKAEELAEELGLERGFENCMRGHYNVGKGQMGQCMRGQRRGIGDCHLPE